MPIDMSAAAKAPPARGTANRSARVQTPRKTQTEKRADAINEFFQLGSFASIMFNQFADAATFAIYGERVAPEVAEFANTDERIAKALDSLTTVGPAAKLFSAVMPMAIQFLVNHGRMPADKLPPQLGIMDPEALAAKAKAEAIKQAARLQEEAAEAMREAQLAAANAQELKEQMEWTPNEESDQMGAHP